MHSIYLKKYNLNGAQKDTPVLCEYLVQYVSCFLSIKIFTNILLCNYGRSRIFHYFVHESYCIHVSFLLSHIITQRCPFSAGAFFVVNLYIIYANFLICIKLFGYHELRKRRHLLPFQRTPSAAETLILIVFTNILYIFTQI